MNKTGFGFWRLPRVNPTDDKIIDYELLNAMVDSFLAQGGDYFDTAYTYLGGRSEEALRKSLVQRYPRDRFRIADKLPGYQLKSYEACNIYFEESLRRCGVDYFFKLEEIAELGFRIEVKKPPRHDGWSCSITFNGKDQAKFNADMCLFLENWADERKRRRSHKEEYEQWQKDTLAYYAANAVTEKAESEEQVTNGFTFYEDGYTWRKPKNFDNKGDV